MAKEEYHSKCGQFYSESIILRLDI